MRPIIPLSKKQALERILARASRSHLNISQAGVDLIISQEGIRNEMYDDGGPGKGNATIGVGHLIHEGPIDGSPPEAPFLQGLTYAEVEALLTADLKERELAVSRAIYWPLTQAQFDALMDFTFNCGVGALIDISNVVNKGGDVCAAMKRYVHDGNGVELSALVARRQIECQWFMRDEEDGLSQKEYDDLKAALDADIAAVLKALGDLGKKVDDLAAIAWRDAVRLNALEAK